MKLWLTINTLKNKQKHLKRVKTDFFDYASA